MTPICLCRQVCLLRSSPSYKLVLMGSERPPLANNWRLDCPVSIWRVSWDRLCPAVLWKGQSNPDLAGYGKTTGKGNIVEVKTGKVIKIKRIRFLKNENRNTKYIKEEVTKGKV